VWRDIDVRRVEHRQQVFVIVTGKAFVIEVSEATEHTLRGTAVRMWSFEPRRFSVRESESPDETARRLGWMPLAPGNAPHEIRIADIMHLSAPGTRGRGGDVAGGVAFLAGAVALILLVTGALAGAALGGHR
jgi:hypothetical protein